MASLSYELQLEFYGAKDYFMELEDYDSAFALDAAVDLGDAISKQYLPRNEYLARLLTVFTSNLATQPEAKEGWEEAIRILKTKMVPIV